MVEAMYYEKMNNGKVHCRLCPHGCILSSGGLGACRARKNIDGRLHSLNYALVTSVSLDPIEKKPLYHFHPGRPILSVGTFGCNFRCGFCQNWTIAQKEAQAMELNPSELADLAEKYVEMGNIGVAYTYNEPSIWYEYVYEAAKLVRGKGLANVLVTNGFICNEPFEQLLPFIDAMNIDVKAFTEEFYKKQCKGSLEDVVRTVERAASSCHVEITTLLIPGLNDSLEEISSISKWLSSINPEIVLHLTRFFPNYKMTGIPATPKDVMGKARSAALDNLKHVYLGNI